MKPIDISPIVSTKTPVFPGDTPYEASMVLTFGNGSNYELTKITATPHIGAHANAPSH